VLYFDSRKILREKLSPFPMCITSSSSFELSLDYDFESSSINPLSANVVHARHDAGVASSGCSVSQRQNY